MKEREPSGADRQARERHCPKQEDERQPGHRRSDRIRSRSSEEERKRFFELTDRLMRLENADEEQRLKDELAQLVFGA